MKTITDRIAEHPFFCAMSPRNIARAAAGAVERVFAPGDIILREGEPANRFYLIESGGVALEAHEPADGTFPIQVLTKGDVLGWSWLLSPFVWHFQARVIEPTIVLVLDAAELLAEAEEDHDFGYELLKRTAHVLMGRLRATRSQLVSSELSAFREHAGDCAATSLVTVAKPAENQVPPGGTADRKAGQ
jgi:CRP/FNR family cyclic AMP-dependent transcriptional regulator